MEPSAWTRQHRYGLVGTVFDYAVGSIWGKQSLAPVFSRVRAVSMRHVHLQGLVTLAEEIIDTEMAAVRRGRRTPAQLDFFRACAFISSVDAMSRAPVRAPDWTYTCRARKASSFRKSLRSEYPTEFVTEVLALLALANERLPQQRSTVTYDPVFGSKLLPHVGADGDLLIDGTLVELKASVDALDGWQLWQLLGYQALDRIQGYRRIDELSIYSARRGHLWRMYSVELIQRLGGSNIDSFAATFFDHMNSIKARPSGTGMLSEFAS